LSCSQTSSFLKTSIVEEVLSHYACEEKSNNSNRALAA